MIDKSVIRKQLLHQMIDVDVKENLKTEIDNLSIYNDLNSLDMKAFYSDLNKIISWGEINSIQHQHDALSTDETFFKILNILTYASSLWRESYKSGNLEKAVISFIIGERLFLKPEVDFYWDLKDSMLREKLEISLKALKFEISDELPEYTGYSDKKFNSDYKNAVITNDYKGIFIFFDALERGSGLHSEITEYIKIIIRIAIIVDLKLLSRIIGTFSPALMHLVISLTRKEKISNLLSHYNEDYPLPLLMGLRKIVTPNNINNQDDKLSVNWDFIEKSSEIVEKIAELCTCKSLYKYLTESIRYSHSKLWNIIFAAFIARNEEYISDYAENINFNFNEFGESSFNTFNHFGNEVAMSKLSTQLFSKFLSSVEEMEYRQHPFIFSSFYNYFFHAVQAKSEQSYTKYHSTIEEISTKLLRSLYSWDLYEYEVYFTELIYWILSVKAYGKECKMKLCQFKHTNRIIEDKKIMNLVKIKQGDVVVDFHELKLLLEDPEKINSVVLPLQDRAIELTWPMLES